MSFALFLEERIPITSVECRVPSCVITHALFMLGLLSALPAIPASARPFSSSTLAFNVVESPQLPETSIRRASELAINRGHAEDHLADIRLTPMDFFPGTDARSNKIVSKEDIIKRTARPKLNIKFCHRRLTIPLNYLVLGQKFFTKGKNVCQGFGTVVIHA